MSKEIICLVDSGRTVHRPEQINDSFRRQTRDHAQGEDFVILACTVLTQFSRRTDGQTDRRTGAQVMAKTREAFCYGA